MMTRRRRRHRSKGSSSRRRSSKKRIYTRYKKKSVKGVRTKRKTRKWRRLKEIQEPIASTFTDSQSSLPRTYHDLPISKPKPMNIPIQSLEQQQSFLIDKYKDDPALLYSKLVEAYDDHRFNPQTFLRRGQQQLQERREARRMKKQQPDMIQQPLLTQSQLIPSRPKPIPTPTQNIPWQQVDRPDEFKTPMRSTILNPDVFVPPVSTTIPTPKRGYYVPPSQSEIIEKLKNLRMVLPHSKQN